MTELERLYKERYKLLVDVAQDLQNDLENHLNGFINIDRIFTRAKSIKSFLAKAEKRENGILKYSEPLSQIQDQLGARITCYYLSDVDKISQYIKRYYFPIEQKKIIPESESEFGYVGEHFTLHIPSDVIPKKNNSSFFPSFFELQIKTLFQHAWSEASHDLAYKPSTMLTTDQKRKIAFTAAQAWGADVIFEELNEELNCK